MHIRWNKATGAALTAALLLAPIAAQAKKNQKDLSANPLQNVQTKQPDKELFEKAMHALKKGRFEIARLDLQTLLNTYPDSEFQMRAKLAVGDTWYKEGGTAALTQAESEYKDFITFFPQAPEAAEAQMRVADIYYMQMEKPDRDFSNTVRAEAEYRAMLQQYPDSPLTDRAKQRLREVQEVLAERDYQIGAFYATRENYGASVARLQTVADTFPLYSKSDEVLMTLGDDYSAQALLMGNARQLSNDQRVQLRRIYEDKAAAAYSKVITRYPMAPHVEDARDRLVAMNRTVPEPTAEELALSDAEEHSRQAIKLSDRVMGFVKRTPSTIEAARVGEPNMDGMQRTYAPTINKTNADTVMAVVRGQPLPAGANAAATAADAQNAASTNGTAPPRTESPASMQLEDVGGDGTGQNQVGATIVNAPAQGAASQPVTTPDENTPPAVPVSGQADPSLVPAGAKNPNQQALPAAEAPAAAPEQVNDVRSGGAQTATSTTDATADGKKKKKASDPKFDDSNESSSKHKKKKGLKKVNPF